MGKVFGRFLRNKSGATAVEYGMIVALIATVIITSLTTIGTQINAKFTTIAGSLR